MPLVSSSTGVSGRGLGLFGNTLAQLSTIFDNFNRANSSSLGFTSDGNAQWSVLSGSFSISSNVVTSTGTSGVAVVDLGASNVTASLSLSWGGDALYFRVVDANNWWRVGTYLDQVTTTTPYNYTRWNWYSEYSPYSEAGGAYGCPPTTPHTHPGKSAFGQTSSNPAPWCNGPLPHAHPMVYPNCTFGATGPNTPIPYPNGPHVHSDSCYSVSYLESGTITDTTNYYYVVLEKAVGGSITQVQSYVSTNAFTVTSVQVTANGSLINVKFNGGASNLFSDTTDSAHSTATRHGIGRRNPLDASSSSMDNFQVTRI